MSHILFAEASSFKDIACVFLFWEEEASQGAVMHRELLPEERSVEYQRFEQCSCELRYTSHHRDIAR